MLFLISSNSPKTWNIYNSWSVASSGSLEILDELVSKIDEDEEQAEEIEAEKEDIISSEANLKKEKKSFSLFSFFRSDKKSKKEDIISNESEVTHKDDKESEEVVEEESKQEVVVDSTVTKEEEKESKDEEKNTWIISKIFGKKSEETVEENFVIETSNKKTPSEWENLMKEVVSDDTPEVDYTYAPEVKKQVADNFVYPGKNLETSPGQELYVWVHSLKLNNAYFTETIWYLMNWDTVKQVSEESSRGCFLVEVIASQSTTIWTKWYVCKKWLTDSSAPKVDSVQTDSILAKEVKEELKNEKEESIPADVVEMPVWKLGDLMTIESGFTLFAWEVALEKWDVVNQLSDVDANGCYDILVLSTKIITSQGKVVNICK